MDRSTELRRLARTLHRQPDELGYLDALAAEGLQALRRSMQNSMLDRYAPTFEKMANSGKLVPNSLSAMLCQKIFGPTLTANMSYYTPTDRAAAMCGHLEPEFMADIGREQIPERAQKMLAELPVELMREVTRILLKSGDFHVMGGFTDYMPEDKVLALMDEITDQADSLRVSLFTQHKDRIARISVALSDDKIKQLIVAAFTTDEFIQEVGLITSEMGDSEQQRMAKLTDDVNPDFRKQSLALAEANGLRDKLQAYFDYG